MSSRTVLIRQRILSSLPKTASKTIPLTEAAGCFLAEDVYAKLTLPPYDVSSMDGYAINSTDIINNPSLKIVDIAAAGRPSSEIISKGTTIRIFTGATLPLATDSVVMF